MLGFNVNKREVVFRGKLTAVSPLRVGAGQGHKITDLIDLSCIKVTIGDRLIPYIPGSSLKGVLRSAAEGIIRTARLKGNNLNACYPYLDSSCAKRYGNKLMRLQEEVKRSEDVEEAISRLLDFVEKNYCLACRIFGATGIMSHVAVKDCYGIDGSYSFGTRRGVAIDRRTGAVAKRALYTVEFLNPGSEFDFELVMKNMPNYQVGLVAAAIKGINDGRIHVGGMKSRGFGRAKITVREATLDCKQIPDTIKALGEDDYPVVLQPEGDYTEKLLNAFEEAWIKFAEAHR
ncbi:MAG: CRISPR-associated RAMP protein Csx7 [Candidatus Jordarchaeales archaeon]